MASSTGARRFTSVTRALLLLAGIGLAFLLIWKTGWTAVEANLASIGWWFVGLTALYLLAEIAFTLGWRAVMEPRPPLSSLPDLLRIYLAGNTLNYLAPGSVAGEPVRANMLRDRLETSRAIASVTIFKHAHLLSQALYVALGLGVAVVYFELSAAVRWTALGGVFVLCALLVLMTWGLRKGSFAPILSGLSRLSLLRERLARYRENAEELDRVIRRFYVDRRRHFFEAAAWCFVGWCGGLLETYIVLRLLAPGRGWETAFAAESLAMLLNNMFLFVPARAGTAEGIRTGVFVLLGLPASTGLAYGLIRRGRELLWVAGGLAFLGGPRRGREASSIPSTARLAGSGSRR
ncbi:MAG TPA: lysylphosphatidylglycerol synthase domain-containing protein [Thermoanaerobaculia bacterium]|nr:lysylphosphatidylglycerol synthase domain-containing protein [Thermoanaerobaculia bacterium]